MAEVDPRVTPGDVHSCTLVSRRLNLSPHLISQLYPFVIVLSLVGISLASTHDRTARQRTHTGVDVPDPRILGSRPHPAERERIRCCAWLLESDILMVQELEG